MTAVTAAHPAVAVLKSAIAAAMTGPLAQVAVLDAVNPGVQAYSARSVTLGGRWDPDTSSLSTDQTITVESGESGAGRLPVEVVTVEGVAYAGSGDQDFAARRSEVGEALSAVSTAVRAIREVEGASAMARLSAQLWAQGADTNGTFVLVSFTITVNLLP